jgi:hypothetical protein
MYLFGGAIFSPVERALEGGNKPSINGVEGYFGLMWKLHPFPNAGANLVQRIDHRPTQICDENSARASVPLEQPTQNTKRRHELVPPRTAADPFGRNSKTVKSSSLRFPTARRDASSRRDDLRRSLTSSSRTT